MTTIEAFLLPPLTCFLLNTIRATANTATASRDACGISFLHVYPSQLPSRYVRLGRRIRTANLDGQPPTLLPFLCFFFFIALKAPNLVLLLKLYCGKVLTVTAAEITAVVPPGTMLLTRAHREKAAYELTKAKLHEHRTASKETGLAFEISMTSCVQEWIQKAELIH